MVGPISFVCVLIEHCSKINQLVQAILMSIDCPFTQRDCGCRAFNQIIEDDFAVIVGGLCSTVCFQQGFVPGGNAERPSLQPVVILDNTVQSVKSFFVMTVSDRGRLYCSRASRLTTRRDLRFRPTSVSRFCRSSWKARTFFISSFVLYLMKI